jgi:hypothetical protein
VKHLLILIAIMLVSVTTHAQQTFTPTCAGTNDTAAFQTIITGAAGAERTITIPRKTPATRCAVSTLVIPSNITLDNTNGTGIKVNTGQTLTTGPVVTGPGKQMFYNIGAGLGSVSLANSTVKEVDVSWFGPANAVNSSAIIDAAFSAAMTTTAPSATLYFPKGRWVIGTPIIKNLATASTQSQFIIRGDGSASQLVLGVTGAETALAIQNGHKLIIRDLVVVGNGVPVGVNAPNWDVWRGISITGTLQAELHNVDFFGLHSQTTVGGAVLYGNNANIHLQTVAFRGCSANVSIGNSTIFMDNWRAFTVDNLEMLDFGVLNGIFYSGASSSPGDGWIKLGNVAAPTINSYSGGYAYLRNVVVDEGTYFGLRTLTTDGSTIQSVIVDGWRANITINTSFVIGNVKRFILRDSKVAYSQAAHAENIFPALTLDNVELAEIIRTDFLQMINTVSVGTGVGYVRVEDSTVQRITNPNCAIVQEYRKGHLLPRSLCNVNADRAGSSEVLQYFDPDAGRFYASFDGQPPFPLHSGKAASPFYDFFTETTLDATKWDATSSANITPTQTSNRLRFTVANSAGADATPGTYISDNTYDMSKNGMVSVHLPTLPVTATTGTFKQTLIVTAADGTTPIYSMFIDSANNGQIIMVDDAGSSGNPLNYAPYWRIRYIAGATNAVHFEISANNTSWSTIRTANTTATVTAVKFRLETWSINTPATVTVHPSFDTFRFSQYYPALLTDDGVTLTTTSPLTLASGPALTEGRLATVPLVNMNSGATQVLYTCPTGKTCIVTKVIVHNASASLTTASYSFQWNSAGDVVANATHTELVDNTVYTQLFPKVGATRGVAGATFDVIMNTLQGGAASTTMDVFGYTF